MAPGSIRSGFLIEDKGRERRELCEQIDALQVAKAKAAAAEEFREAAALKKQVTELQAKLENHDAEEEARTATRAAEARTLKEAADAEVRAAKEAEARVRAEAELEAGLRMRINRSRSFESRLTVRVPVSAAFAFIKSLEGIGGAGHAPRLHLGPGVCITHYESGLAQLTEMMPSEVVENVAVAFRVTVVKPKIPGVARLESAEMITTVEQFRAWPFYRFKTMWRLRESSEDGSEFAEIERAIVDFHQYELQDFDALAAVGRAMEAENEKIRSKWPAVHAAAQSAPAQLAAAQSAPAQLAAAPSAAAQSVATESAASLLVSTPVAAPQAPTSRRAGRFTATLASREPAAAAPAVVDSEAPARAVRASEVERGAAPLDVLVRHATETAELRLSVTAPGGGEPTFLDVRSALEAVLAGASAEGAVPSGRRPRLVMKREGVYKAVRESDFLNEVREVVVLGVSLRAVAASEGRE